MKHAVTRTRAPRNLTWLIAIPALAVVVLFGVFPVIVLLIRSFGLGEIGALESPGPTLDYYLQVFTYPALLRSVRNSIIVALGSVLITAVISVVLVLYLAKESRAGRASAMSDALITLPITLPGIVIGFFAIILLGRTGLVGKVFPPAQGLAFTFIGLFIAYIFFSIPRIVSPLRGAAETLDPELGEVAKSLGASDLRVFWTITLPLLLPAVIEVSGTAAAVALGGYGTVATLSEGIRLLPLDVVDSLNNGFNVATSSAQAVVLAVMSILALVLGRVGSKFAAKAVR